MAAGRDTVLDAHLTFCTGPHASNQYRCPSLSTAPQFPFWHCLWNGLKSKCDLPQRMLHGELREHAAEATTTTVPASVVSSIALRRGEPDEALWRVCRNMLSLERRPQHKKRPLSYVSPLVDPKRNSFIHSFFWTSTFARPARTGAYCNLMKVAVGVWPLRACHAC